MILQKVCKEFSKYDDCMYMRAIYICQIYNSIYSTSSHISEAYDIQTYFWELKIISFRTLNMFAFTRVLWGVKP